MAINLNRKGNISIKIITHYIQGRSPGGGNGNPLRHSCLGNPMDRGAWWPTVHQEKGRNLEWCVCGCVCVGVCARAQSFQVCLILLQTPWTVAHHPPLSVEFSRQEHWSGLPFPFPGDLPDPGIEPVSSVSPALVGRSFYQCTIWEA